MDKLKFKETEKKREFREDIKNKLRQSNIKLPSFAKYTPLGRISCSICGEDSSDLNAFKLHLKDKRHIQALDRLKEELLVQEQVNRHVAVLLDEEQADCDPDNTMEESPLSKRPPQGHLEYEERIVERQEQKNEEAAAEPLEPEKMDEEVIAVQSRDLGRELINNQYKNQEEAVRQRLQALKDKIRTRKF